MGGSDPYAHQRAGDFFIDLIAERRANPRDDLMSDLARIPEDELEGKLDIAGRRVGLILTGGNLDLDVLPWSERNVGGS